MDPAAVLITTTFVIMLVTLIVTSYKTGFVAYSIWSATRPDQPRYKIEKDKIGKFSRITAGVFLLNIVYGLVVARDMSQISGILVLSLFNTIVIGFGLSFWVLLKEKKQS